MNTPPVITIDGPSASGKGAVSSLLAQSIGFRHLESGILYRALGRWSIENNLLSQSNDEIVRSICALSISWSDDFKVQVEGFILKNLHCPEVGLAASRVGAIPQVRAFLYQLQRDALTWPGLIAEGRDMGSVIFPEAKLKIFLTASLEERAKRRFSQLKQRDMCVTMSKILEDISARDHLDQSRPCSSLSVADDALVIDSTNQSLKQVVEKIINAAHQRILITR